MKSEEIPQQPVYGRTGFDFLYFNRKAILVVVAILLYALLVRVFDFDVSSLKPYYPFVLGPVVGYFLGVQITRNLLDVPCVILKETDQTSRTCRSWAVPLSVFMKFNQSGNGFELHDGFGRPVYFCDSIDFDECKIVYSWPFTRPFFEVISNIDYYDKIVEDYNSLCIEVLHLRKHLASIMLRQTRQTSKELMDEISSVLSGSAANGDIFRDTIFEPETDLDDTEFISQEISEEESE